jgi:hypothetical protein
MESAPKIPDKFSSIVNDFANDLCITFPEHVAILAKWKSDINADDLAELHKHCLAIYPKHFFDILYQNDDVFKTPGEAAHFFPGLDFSLLYNCEGVSETTKKTIWKYLQLVLFTIIQGVKDKANFGDSMNMFDGIDEKDLHEKLKETMTGIADFFSKLKPDQEQEESGAELPKFEMPDMGEFAKNFPFPGGLPNMDNIQDHLRTLFNGKIGSLAKEMAEEITEEFKDMLGEEANNLQNPDDAMKLFTKDPKKLIALMKKISTKLDKKMKDGDISREEMMQEASEMLNKMKEMGGGDQMKDMFEKFAKGMGGMGKNMRLDTNALTRMTNMEHSRNRMRSKLQAKKERQAEVVEKMKQDRQKLLAEQANALSKTAGYTLDQVTPDNLVFRLDGEEIQEKTLINNADRMADLLIAEETREKTAVPLPKNKKNKNKGKK